MSFVIAGNSASTGYNLTRSLRFRASASASLTRAPSVTSNRTTWTWSSWVKRGQLGTTLKLFSGGVVSPPVYQYTTLVFDSSDRLVFNNYNETGGGATDFGWITTTQVFRDPSAWYHIVAIWDTTNATASNRMRLYVNGVQITSFTTGTFSTTYPPQNSISFLTSSSFTTSIAKGVTGDTANYFDGYLAEVNFIDGQALTPSSFGSTNALTGVWQPARYTGTYGTNGFYLPFTDNSALTTSSNVGLGKDFSGNANYWVTNNISITAGVTYDSMTDVPTLTDASTANYAVINPIVASANNTVSNGNLTYVGTAAGNRTITLTGAFKQYGEITIGSGSQSVFGLATPTADLTQNAGVTSNGLYGIYDNGGGFFLFSNGTLITSIGTQTSAGVVFQLAYDAVGGKLWIGRNNVWYDSALGTTGNPSAGTNPTLSGLPANLFMFVGTGNFATITYNCNFGQRPFTYTAPTGFLSLNTFNLPDSTILKGNTVMDATLYTGTGASLSVTNAASFKPDLVWVKSRSAATDHAWYDSVRGTTKQLESNTTTAETTEATGLTAFGSAGFTVGALAQMNTNTATYVGWQWQAGQGSSSSNTNGTITSTVSVNASAGFSVVTYTGTGANATVGHGLGVAPSLVIIKNRSGTDLWVSYHASLGATGYVSLSSSAAFATLSTVFNNTTPTSSVFSIGTASGVNATSNNYVAYCWTPIAGYSAFGSIATNSSADNAFVYTGFLPRFILFKRSDSTSDWGIFDTARNTYNVMGNLLNPNLSSAESSVTYLDVVSNGFKLRSAGFGGTWIYAAFATTPFKNSLGF